MGAEPRRSTRHTRRLRANSGQESYDHEQLSRAACRRAIWAAAAAAGTVCPALPAAPALAASPRAAAGSRTAAGSAAPGSPWTIAFFSGPLSLTGVAGDGRGHPRGAGGPGQELAIGDAAGRTDYQDPHTGTTAAWEYATWTSPVHRLVRPRHPRSSPTGTR